MALPYAGAGASRRVVNAGSPVKVGRGPLHGRGPTDGRGSTLCEGARECQVASTPSLLICQKIIDDVRNKPVTIIADGTTDCGHHEQMAEVVRYFSGKKMDSRNVRRFVARKAHR